MRHALSDSLGREFGEAGTVSATGGHSNGSSHTENVPNGRDTKRILILLLSQIG